MLKENIQLCTYEIDQYFTKAFITKSNMNMY